MTRFDLLCDQIVGNIVLVNSAHKEIDLVMDSVYFS
jgi:hypothetical protein